MSNAFNILLAALALHAATTLSASPPVPSPQMSVADFLERVGDLAKMGPGWIQSPEAGELFAVISGTGKTYRQTLTEQRAAGAVPEACLPEEAEIDSDQLFAHLAGYSANAARRTSIAEAFAELVRKRYPCP